MTKNSRLASIAREGAIPSRDVIDRTRRSISGADQTRGARHHRAEGEENEGCGAVEHTLESEKFGEGPDRASFLLEPRGGREVV